ncbi:MAG: hypothetical protein ACLTDV_02385 [Eubacterium sp.]
MQSRDSLGFDEQSDSVDEMEPSSALIKRRCRPEAGTDPSGEREQLMERALLPWN